MNETNDFTPVEEEAIEEEFAEEVSEAEENPSPELDLGSDLEELAGEFPELCSLDTLSGSERYKELRALGLTPAEAYLASVRRTPKFDSRSHLKTSVPRSAKSPGGAMSRQELIEARELFSGLSDRQIEDLYRKVTK